MSIHPLGLTPQGQPFSLNPLMTYTDPFDVCDRYWNGNAWLNPQMYICPNVKRKELSPRKIEQNKWTKEWILKERDNGREIVIGKFSFEDVMIINPTTPTNYDAICFNVNCEEGENKTNFVTIPAKDFKKRNILQYFSFLRRNPDCPDKYLVDAICLALQNEKDIRMLVPPKRSGFAESRNGDLYFGSQKSIYPGLDKYYPVNVCERMLVQTSKSLYDIAKEYAKVLPNLWQYKLLIAIRIASLLLYFTETAGITPDQIFVVEPASKSTAKIVIALLKTQNYLSQNIISLMANTTELKAYLRKINDGVAVFYDDAYAEEWRKHNNHVHTLVDDLQGANGLEDYTRHLIAIVSENPADLPHDVPTMFIDISDKICLSDPDKLQVLSGEFDTGLIEAILRDPSNTRRYVENIINDSMLETHTISASENYNSKRLVRIGLKIMQVFRLVSKEECAEIHKWLKCGYEVSKDSFTSIVNDFRCVFNDVLFKIVGVVTQNGSPFYIPGKSVAFVDDNYINFEAKIWDVFLIRMKRTKKRLKLINALDECNLIYGNNGYKRNLVVEVSPGKFETVSVYSVSKELLNAANTEKLNDLSNSDYLIDCKTAHTSKLHMMITNSSKNRCIGQVIEHDENYHQSIHGKSRFGKTKYLCEQAVESALHNEQVVIFDHSGSFTKEELEKHLPTELVERHFCFWNIQKQGLPVNLADLSYCDTLTEKKQRLLSVYAAGARLLGTVQEKVLKKKIGTMIKDKGDDVDIVNILGYFTKDGDRFSFLSDEFKSDQQVALLHSRSNMSEKMGIESILDYLDEKGRVENALRNKLEDIFGDLEALPKSTYTWSKFLAMQKKVVIISTGTDGHKKSSYLIDMLLASFYDYKQYSPEKSIVLILDECSDLYLDTDGPVDVMLRKGGKHGIRMLLATQEFSLFNSKFGKIIGNGGTILLFRPKDNDIAEVAKITGVDKAVLAKLEKGQCVIHGLLYNKTAGKNKQHTIIGWTYKHDV